MAALNPDVLIVPECEKMDEMPGELGSRIASSFYWFGTNPRKGLAAVSFGEYRLAPLEIDEIPKWIVPLQVTGPQSFILFAVWTIPVADSRSYVMPLLKAHRLYQQHWNRREIVWAGDFNASVLFDKPSRRYKFRDFVDELEADGIRSLYHEQQNCRHGEEPHKSFFHYHHESRGHHIDYILASSNMRGVKYSINLGKFADWSLHSDHVPVVCDFSDSAVKSSPLAQS